MSEAASMLEMEKVCFICTDDKYDEILLTTETKVYEYSSQDGLRTFTLSHQTFGFPETNFGEIQGESPSQNAKILQEVLSGEKKNAAYFVTVANAALGLYSADYEEDLSTCAAVAEEAILSGKAMNKLDALREFGSNNS
jgi:anthranilate phosphoribosyltransferase